MKFGCGAAAGVDALDLEKHPRCSLPLMVADYVVLVRCKKLGSGSLGLLND